MGNHAAMSAGNVAVITGAADGIGLAAACRYTGFGMPVLLADRDSERLAAATKLVGDIGKPHEVRVLAKTIDVAKYDEVVELKSLAYTEFGQVDVLMNNAGTSEKTGSWDALDAWQQIVAVNMWGVIHGVQAFTQAMIDQATPGLIINTGSKQGITNPPGNPAYNVSKAGVKSATESLQHTLRNIDHCKITAHLLVPGFTYTGLVKRFVGNEKPAGAWMPDEVVDYMLEAISRGSFYIVCPDNEVTRDEDTRRVLWAAGDLAYDRSPLSRWDDTYKSAFAEFKADEQ